MKLALLLISILPLSPVATAHVDRVEHHTKMDDEGREVFRQYIFHRWNAHHSRWDVMDWLVDNGQVHREGTTYIFHRFGVLYRVTSGQQTESVSQDDPELKSRDIVPLGMRRKLFGAIHP